MKPGYTATELADWCAGEWHGSPPDEVTGVSHDTRTLNTGELYLAIRGETHDGHTFVDAAFRRGAAGAVVAADAACQATPQQPLLVVADTSKALRDMAVGYRLKVNPHIVGVTGSVGKSTVKEMTAQILATTAPTAATKGNCNNDIGLPLSLLAMPADTARGVFEVGMNHPGEIEDLCRLLKPRWGVVTSIGPVHMEFFRSVDDVATEKASVLRGLPPDGLAFLNRDDAFFDLLAQSCPGKIVTISNSDGADYVCVHRELATRGVTVRETATGEEHVIRVPSINAYNVTNAMLAIAVARALSIGWDDVQAAFDRYRAMPMRWQESTVGSWSIVNDAYNANPLSMRASISAFREHSREAERWLVLGGMNELGKIAHAEHVALGRSLAEGPWTGLVTVGELGADIAAGAEEGGFPGDLVVAADCRVAADAIAERVGPGSALLLKASRGIHLEKVVERLIAIQGEER